MVDKAFVIREGKCEIVSKRAPVTISQKTEFESNQKEHDKMIKENSKRGYFSKTMNTMQIGIVRPGEMIGDELLLLGD